MTHMTFLEAAVEGDQSPTSQFWKLHATFQSFHAVGTSPPAPDTAAQRL